MKNRKERRKSKGGATGRYYITQARVTLRPRVLSLPLTHTQHRGEGNAIAENFGAVGGRKEAEKSGVETKLTGFLVAFSRAVSINRNDVQPQESVPPKLTEVNWRFRHAGGKKWELTSKAEEEASRTAFT